MDFLLILAAILWIAVSASNKKKRQQAKEEAARRQAQESQSSPGPVAQGAPKPAPNTAPQPMAAQAPDASGASFDPYFSGTTPAPAPPSPRRAAPPRRVAGSTLSEGPQASARKAMEAQVQQPAGRRHTLEASSITGHAHTESSITGFVENCPPATPASAKVAAAAAAPSPAGDQPFSWNVQDVAHGLVLAEILGKPKALKTRT